MLLLFTVDNNTSSNSKCTATLLLDGMSNAYILMHEVRP